MAEHGVPVIQGLPAAILATLPIQGKKFWELHRRDCLFQKMMEEPGVKEVKTEAAEKPFAETLITFYYIYNPLNF